MIERFKIWLNIKLNSKCNETKKKLLNWLAISFGLVRNSPLLLRNSFRYVFDIINVVSEIIIIIKFFTLL